MQHQTSNAADNTATQAYNQRTDTQPSSAPTNNPPQDPARAGSSSPTAQKPELYQPHHTPRPYRHQNKSIAADTPNGDQQQQPEYSNQEHARAHSTQGPAGQSQSLEFLRLAGSIFAQIDTVLQQAVSRFKIEERLLSEKMGISGLQDLYKTAVDRHDNMLLLDPESSGEPLMKAIAEFFYTFQGTKACSEYTAAAATLWHTAQASEGFNLQVRQAPIAGMG